MPGQINMSKRQAVLGVLFMVYVAFGAWALYTFVTSKYPGANDFYQRWRGAKAFWVEGRDPYGADVARDVEIELYGTPYNPDPALDEYPGEFSVSVPHSSTACAANPIALLYRLGDLDVTNCGNGRFNLRTHG
jgi:hypothetical protein